MSRPRSFDREEVLDKAIRTFWAKGYEATSLQDLVSSMGIQRQSIYDTFGNKHALFIAALSRYCQKVICTNLERLDEPGSPLANLRRFFQQKVDDLIDVGPLQGCLVTNSATERALFDVEASEKVAKGLRLMESAFNECLLRAREVGEIPLDSDTDALAAYLLNAVQGLFVIGKVRSDRRYLEQIINVTFSGLAESKGTFPAISKNSVTP